jgi:NAD+ synthase
MPVTTTSSLDLTLSEVELEDRREHIVGFIREQARAAGTDRAVIGLSGGIDSTTTAHLAVEALGADAVHGLVMPSTVNREANMSDAERVAGMLGISHDVIEIEPIVEAFYDAYPEGADDQVAAGNVRVRARAVLNYFVANHENAIVLGTGNRSEALVGYFTKYGDGAVDCLPIGNLYKQQVRQLARDLGVPEDLVTKTPSAGMWVGQTDEAELGIDYDTLDAILALTVDGGVPISAATDVLEGVTREEIEYVHGLYEASAHKRRFPPAPDPSPGAG